MNFAKFIVFGFPAVLVGNSFGAALPDALQGIPLPAVKFYSVETIRSLTDGFGSVKEVCGLMPDKSPTIQIPVSTVRAEFSGNAGLDSRRMFDAYVKALTLKGARLVNVADSEARGTFNYNCLWLFVVPVGTELRRMALWINGRHADEHFWFVWPAEKAQLTAQDMQKKINETGTVSLYLNFDNNKSLIRPIDRPQLEQAAGMLKNNQQLNLRVEGHTDNVGQAKANLSLSAARAQSVVDALVAMGVAKDRLTSLGLGDTKPLADNSSPEGRAKNRRVELVKR